MSNFKKKELVMAHCCRTEKESEGVKKCSPCQIMPILIVVAIVVFLGIKFLVH